MRLGSFALGVALVLGGTAMSVAAHAAEAATYRFEVIGRIPGPDGPWDYASFDPERQRVYVSHGNEVMTIDAGSGKLNSGFAAGDDVHAVVPVPRTNFIVTTNSGDASARIIDATDGRLLASLQTPDDPDGAVFDPLTGLVLVVSGEAGKVTLVDPRARKMVGSIGIGGRLEFPAVDGRGKLYVNVVSENEVAAVDLATRRVIAHYPLAGCQAPTGLALVGGGRLISVCFNGRADILDAGSGRAIASVKIGGFPDAVLYDPARHLAFVPSAGSGTMAVIALTGPASNSVIETVHTQVGARTGAVDPRTGRIWLPAARFKRYSLKAVLAAGRPPRMEPRSFAVLVLRVSPTR